MTHCDAIIHIKLEFYQKRLLQSPILAVAQRELQNEIDRLKQSDNVADVEVAFDQVIKQNKSDISHLKSQIDQLKSQIDENTDSTLHDSVHQITCDFESFIRYSSYITKF